MDELIAAGFSFGDIQHMRAAEGWLGLSDAASAQEELQQVQEPLQEHPAMLRLKWAVAGALPDLELAAEVARKLTELRPDEEEGWIHLSYSLHELKRTAEARENLLRVLERFPDSALMHYNLACYECRLGNHDRARELLFKAFRLPDGAQFRDTALEDEDLRELWALIRDLRL